MAEYTDGGIPKRELTLQYKPLSDFGETDADTPSVAGGTEITLYAETIKEIFQKEPTTIPIQKGQDNHFEGDKTLIVDTLKSKHKFEITAWVYSNKNEKHSLDDSILTSGGDEAQISTEDKLSVNEFDKAIPLGDTGIKFDSETVTRVSDGTVLDRDGGDYDMNYARGEITFKDGGPTTINTTTETTEFLGQTINSTTVISDEFQITYTFDASAKNIAKLIRRMSQLGNPLVMRLDKEDLSLEGSNTTFEDAHDYLVIAKKVAISSKSEKPAEHKLELELRKGTIEQ